MALKINEKRIMRVLIRNRKSNLSTRQIAKKSNISPITAKKRLSNLKGRGYVKSSNIGKIRKISQGRGKKSIRTPSKTSWKLRYKKR